MNTWDGMHKTKAACECRVDEIDKVTKLALSNLPKIDKLHEWARGTNWTTSTRCQNYKKIIRNVSMKNDIKWTVD